MRAFLTLQRRKGRNALCLLGRSQSNLETKNPHWKLRKKNTGITTARGGSRKSMSNGTERQWSRTAIRKNPTRRGGTMPRRERASRTWSCRGWTSWWRKSYCSVCLRMRWTPFETIYSKK